MRIIVLFFSLIILLSISSSSRAQITKEKADLTFKEGKYKDALRYYLELYKQNNLDVQINYQLGLCYLNLSIDKSRAIPYLNIAATSITYSETPELYYNLAISHFHAHNFDSCFFYLEETLKRTNDLELIQKVKYQKETTCNAKQLIYKPINVKFVNLGRKINSYRSEINPFVSENETMLIYNSESEDNYDIYYSVKKEKSEDWTKSKKFGSNINKQDNQFVAGISKDGNYLYYYENSSKGFNIYCITKVNGKYVVDSLLTKSLNTKYDETGAVSSPSGDTIYFASNMPGGYGGYDLYYSTKLPNGVWGLPNNLGPRINTQYDENYPSFSDDGQILYFGSNGHNTMGGYDIFYSYMDAEKQWDYPINIGFPINDTYDNYNISILSNKRYAYVSALRNNGFGDYDIYKIIFNEVEPDQQIFRGKITYLDKFGNEKPLTDLSPEITITVYDVKTEKVYGIYAFNKQASTYLLTLIPGNYELVIEGKQYLTYKKAIEVQEDVLSVKIQTFNIVLQQK